MSWADHWTDFWGPVALWALEVCLNMDLPIRETCFTLRDHFRILFVRMWLTFGSRCSVIFADVDEGRVLS